MTRMNQRTAVCTAFGWDYSDASEYQPSWKRGPVKVYNCGDGFAIALKEGQPIPSRIVDEFGPTWKLCDTFAGWQVWEPQPAEEPR